MKKYQMADLKADFSMIQMKSAPVRMIEPYSRDEISKIIGCVDIESPIGIRDRAILLLAFETGLRAVDIIKLKQSDIDWRGAELHVIQNKTNKPLILPLNGTIMNSVADYILVARPKSGSKEIFIRSKSPYTPFKTSCALDGVIEKYCALSGVEKKPYRSFHSLRRSFATELSAAGIPLPTISQMLGHKNVDEARPYLSYNRPQTLFCAMGFDGIPISSEVYAPILSESSPSVFLKGGDDE
ncbi:MAG: tyrosine-type recombinase/integrase [Firmicutes bacterium]|nr:tyrosine-type recombinase/integrase [Bacillota bacterium]